jgi:hypothetical protein
MRAANHQGVLVSEAVYPRRVDGVSGSSPIFESLSIERFGALQRLECPRN